MSDWLRYSLYEASYFAAHTAYSLGFSLRTLGRANVPAKGPCLLVANHLSYLDPVAVGLAARRHIHYLARQTLFRGLFGEFLRAVNCVPVDLEGNATDALRKALKLLEQGEAVLIFPEGTRSATGRMQPLRPGVHLLMRRGNAPIIPVGVAGTFQAWSRHQKRPRFSPLCWSPTGSGIGIVMGQPLDPRQFADMPREQALDLLAHEMQKAGQRAERLRRK